MKLKQTTLAAAVITTLSLAASGQAAASVYAGSSLVMSDMSLIIYDAALGVGAVQPYNSFQFTITNTATLNGVSAAANTATCGGTPTGSDCAAVVPRLETATAANAPGSTFVRGNNDYSFHGLSADQYSSSDSMIYTAEILGGNDLLVGSETKQIAESELQGGLSASSNAEIQSTTGFTFTFTLAQIGALSLEFLADPAMRVAINQPVGFYGYNAQANLTTGITLTNGQTGDSITWSPQGTAATHDCSVDAGLAGVSCLEGRFDLQNPDGVDLNRQFSTGVNGSDINHSIGGGLQTFGLKILNIPTGEWSLSLQGVTSTQLRQQAVPEPETLALLGLGLLGMGLAKRRKM